MSKISRSIPLALCTLLLLSVFPLFSFAITPEERKEIEAIESLMNEEKYRDALVGYEDLFNKGVYTEKMLYRMAFIHEQAGEYPEAIFYLKKIRKEFGGEMLDQKVAELIKKNGGLSYLSADPWENYFVYFNRYYWLIWSLFGLTMGFLVFHFIQKGSKEFTQWRKTLARVSLLIFFGTSALLAHHEFFSPKIAVITSPTAFYWEPGYGAKSKLNALAEGETVRVVETHDIWLKVKAGEKEFWVPQHVVKYL